MLSLKSYNSASVKIASGFSVTLDANAVFQRYERAEANKFNLEVLAGGGYVRIKQSSGQTSLILPVLI